MLFYDFNSGTTKRPHAPRTARVPETGGRENDGKGLNQNASQGEDVVIHGVGVQRRGIGAHRGTDAESGIAGEARTSKLPHGRPYGPKELREPRSRRCRDRSRRRDNCMPRRATRQPRIASGQGTRSPHRCGTTYPPDSPPGRRATESMPIEFSPASGPNHKFLRCEDTFFCAEKHIGEPKRSQNGEY